MKSIMRAARLASLLLVVFVFYGCSGQIVPPYDETIVGGLSSANEQTLTLFSAMSGGVSKSDFPKYSSRYDGLIGAFESLRDRAAARSVALVSAYVAKLGLPSGACGKDGAASCLNSSPRSIDTIVVLLAQLRDWHRQGDVDRYIVAEFKAHYAVSIHQALTVETALKR